MRSLGRTTESGLLVDAGALTDTAALPHIQLPRFLNHVRKRSRDSAPTPASLSEAESVDRAVSGDIETVVGGDERLEMM